MTTADGDFDRLRRAFAEEAGLAGPDCPSAERIWDAARGALGPVEAGLVVDHLATCGVCAEAWRLALEMRGVEGPASTIPVVPERRASRAWAWPLLAAAATIALAVAAWQVLRPATLNAPTVVLSSVPPAPEHTSAAIGPAIEKAPVILSASRALVFRSPTAGDSFVEDFASAIEPYKKDDYPAAISRLQSLARKYPDADEPPFYLGVSLLLASRRSEAAPPLERAARGRDAIIAGYARRYLALATAK